MINSIRSIPLAARITFLVIVLVFTGLSFSLKLSFNVARDIMTRHTIQDMGDTCTRQAMLFSLYLKEFKDEVKLLADSPGIRGIVLALESKDEEKIEFWKKCLQRRFLSMDTERYLQVYFITFDGNEFLRADRQRDSSGGHFMLTSGLQEKGQLDAVVLETQLLGQGEFYISSIELQREQDAVVQPIISIAMPVFLPDEDDSGQQTPVGMVMVNVDATFLFNIFSDIIIAQIFLVNQDGYFLYNHNNPEQCWGWQLGHPEHTVMELHPAFSQQQNQDGGLLKGDHGEMFFFKRIVLDEKTGEYVTLLLFTTDQKIMSHIEVLKQKMILIAWVTLFVTGLFVYFAVQMVASSIRNLTRKVDLLSTGQDVSFMTTRQDEVGRMSIAFANMVARLEHKKREASEQRDEVQRLNSRLHEKVAQLADSEEIAFLQRKAFETLYEKSTDAILLIEDGKFVECNEATLSMLGYANKEQCLNLHPSVLSPEYQPDGRLSAEKADELLQKALEEGTQHFEWLHTRASGENFWVDIVLTSLVFGKRNVLHVAWRDINARKQTDAELVVAKEALLQQKKAFETLYEKATDTILLIADGKIIDCNEATLTMMHCDSKEEFLNTSPASLSPEYQPDGQLSSEKAADMVDIALEVGHHHFEWLHTRCDGEVFWVDVVFSRLTLDSKTILHGAIRDISVQKQLAGDILKERDAAKQSNRAKSEFLANMSHELRTPMHGVLSYARMGVQRWEKVSREKLQRYFQTIATSGSSLMVLLNDLLDVSKLDAGKMVYAMAQGDIGHWFQRVEKEYTSMAEEKNISFRYLDNNLQQTAWFDGDKIAQVLRNIISNAIKFSFADQDIQISCSEMNERGVLCIQVTISDCGVGIPEAELTHIFDIFTQSSQTRNGAGGTGLGLAICKKIITDHHGRIWAENNPAGGACFSFILPIDKDGFERLKAEG